MMDYESLNLLYLCEAIRIYFKRLFVILFMKVVGNKLDLCKNSLLVVSAQIGDSRVKEILTLDTLDIK